MVDRLSNPIESLIKDKPPEEIFDTVDVAIVGSGYGGSIAAACLAGRGRRVVILERGREYALGDFPVDLGHVPRHVRFQRADSDDPVGYPDALFDLRVGDDMDVLVGNGLGGTSLINANVAVQPDEDDFRDAAWPHAIRGNPSTLDCWFAKASKLLGVVPSHTTTTDETRIPKYQALSMLAEAVHKQCDPTQFQFGPAPVTVTFKEPGANGGTLQLPCTKCGNCVTGCNVGAKNTLMTNALPRAHAQGAELFTGATVLSVMPTHDKDVPWILRLRRTVSEKTPLQDEVFHLAARHVILAAGTLGSTEILMRSRDLHGLKVSGLLGKRFSGNGDAIAFGFAQSRPVHAIGEPVQQPAPGDQYRVGPTITGIVRTRVLDEQGKWRKLTIEDASVPTSISQLFGELVTTGAFLHRLDRPALPAWYKQSKGADPITMAPGVLERSQILLVMGDDGAGGTMKLRQASQKSLDHASLVVDWPSVGDNPALRAADELLSKHDRAPGFDGGQYVPNPFWRPLPERASSVLSGPVPAGRAITVHPLGGCGMGDDIRTGVVNHMGQVFEDVRDGKGTEVYDGLHVLDGSIIPKALGINPLLTIAALSWRAAEYLRESRGWELSHEDGRGRPAVKREAQPLAIAARLAEPQATHLVLREQLIGTVSSVPAWLKEIHPGTQRWAEDKGLILRVEMDIPNLERWLEAGTQTPLRTRAQLYLNRLGADDTRRLHRVHTPPEDLTEDTHIAEGEGTVLLLHRDDVGVLERLWRTGLALWAYYKRRQPFRGLLTGALKRLHRASPSSGGSAPRVGTLEKLFKFCRLGWEYARYRRLQYRLQFRRGDSSFTLEGEKALAWRVDAPRLWDALLNLPFTLRGSRGGAVKGVLEMDMTYLVKGGTPQVKASPHLPATVVGLSRLGMLFGRAILHTHFWEFGAPNYPDEPIPRPSSPSSAPALKVGDRQVLPERVPLWVPLREGGDGIRLWLTRYRHADPAAKPVLLIHGLAQGSLIYSTDTVDPNMAAAMAEAGHDVWLLDYRLSNMLPDPVPQGGWSMDEIARYDIPAAVAYVYSACGDQPVSIFAHCVGATSVAMAILKGWLRVPGTDRQRVACVAFNAIHPWTMPSSVNEFRARFGSFFRDVLGSDQLDPIPVPRPSATQVLFDRIAFSVARYDEEGGDHRRSRHTEDPATVCDRMTFLYGRMWRHTNLDPRTHAALPTLMGPGAGDVYRQLYYFALHERLTDHEGRNTYLTEANILDNWKEIPTFFFHGEESMVFNPQSAERSAIRLDAIINRDSAARQTPVRLLRVPGFGHMDVVFAKDAHETVYGVLKTFFADPWAKGDALEPRHDIDPRRGLRLTAGPVLRAAWVGDDKKLGIRLWAEAEDEVISLVNGARLVGKNVKLFREWKVDPHEPRYHMIDALLEDRGPAAFSLKPQIGSGAAKTADVIQGANDEEEKADKYGVSYPDTMPWLKRLREADVAKPCRDMRFLVGSCRYPGTPFECEASDAIFEGMLPHIAGAANDLPGVHMLFLIGDQIYADATANILDSRAWRDRYGQRYRAAFTSENAQKVLAQLPTHFAIDDHEISDNWTGEAKHSEVFRHAVQSAKHFQSSGRETRSLIDGRQKWQSSALWYSLLEKHEHCCPAFVMDTRSERQLRSYANGRGAELVSHEQLTALTDWLTAVSQGPWSNMPKFIFCGVGIAPISREFAACGTTWRSQDGWPGYPRTMSDVLFKIVTDQIRHVVFVSGDLHLSSASRLTLRHRGAPDVVAWHVVSSGLYAPMPFANAQPSAYDWNQPVYLPWDAGYSVDVEAESGLLSSGRSNFLRLDAEQSEHGWTFSIGVVGSGATGAFLAPAGKPPSGFVDDGRRWRVRL
jgi:cholesterol oxidase